MGYQSSNLKIKCLDGYQIDLDIVKRPRIRRWIRVIEGQAIDISKLIDNGFKVLPKRWIVGNRSRCASKE